jgi:hypothetical protein
MTVEEANKIIAEFMGYKWSKMPDGDIATEFPLGNNQTSLYTNYWASLDALVPVWEKLQETFFSLRITTSDFTCKDKDFWIKITLEKNFFGLADTIQEAAAIATAKAIKDLL